MTHLLQLILVLSLIIVFAKMSGALANRFGQPAVFGEILAGLILGPTVLNMLHWPIFMTPGLTPEVLDSFHKLGLKPFELHSIIEDLAEIGVILLMFIAGLETDVQEMKRVGKTAFWAAFGGVVLPLLSALLIAHYFQHTWSQSLFIGAILTATSVSISAQTLMELKQLKSKEGSTILGAAVIDDVMGIIVLSLVVAFGVSQSSTPGADGPQGMSHIFIIILKMTVFFVLFHLDRG